MSNDPIGFKHTLADFMNIFDDDDTQSAHLALLINLGKMVFNERLILYLNNYEEVSICIDKVENWSHLLQSSQKTLNVMAGVYVQHGFDHSLCMITVTFRKMSFNYMLQKILVKDEGQGIVKERNFVEIVDSNLSHADAYTLHTTENILEAVVFFTCGLLYVETRSV